jgi:hypothetical protein
MKTGYLRRFAWRVSAIAAVLLMAAGALNALEISFLVGEVTLQRDGKSLVPEVRSAVKTGDVISTGKGGIAVLAYEDGSEIKVLEKSRIKIGSAAVKGSDSVSVVSGSINAKFKKLMKEGERKVYTPTTVCAVRGTDFLVGVSDGADSRVDLSEGKLDLRNPYGKIDINENEQAEIGMGGKPGRGRGGASLDDWKAEKDRELEQDPAAKGEQYRGYINRLGDRSSDSSGNISRLNGSLRAGSVKDKKSIEKTGAELGALEQNVEEDMYLNEAAGSSIDGILNRFQKDREDMYSAYLKIKEESNKVREQQQRNYEAIQEVREAYRKAYEEIMKTHKDYMEKIKGGLDKGSIKPEMKK